MTAAFDTVLVANRGEIALRVVRACRDLGLQSVAVYSEADARSPHVLFADRAVAIGPTQVSDSYLDPERILGAARTAGAQAVHPGYGFLSENADFAQACRDAGLTFVGPPPAAIRAMGEKVRARERMAAAGVPIVPGSGALAEDDRGEAAAAQIGYPVVVKASSGGGGMGMRVVRGPDGLAAAVAACRRTAAVAFGDPTVFLERYVDEPRHVEIQVLADRDGRTVHLGERECSIQRRHQKILEESPSTVCSAELRERMGRAAVQAARAVGYVNAGTVEFIVSHGDFYFLEMNTRLQVEHPVTELTYGVDLVALQLRIAQGEPLPFAQRGLRPRGWTIECRVNAEVPWRGFLPNPGRVRAYHEPQGPGVRIDSGLVGPGEVSSAYDPLLAKLIVHGADRSEAIQRARRALLEFWVDGITTTIPYHAVLLADPDFVEGRLSTAFIEQHPGLAARAEAWAASQRAHLEGQWPDPRLPLAAAAAAVAADDERA